MLTNLLFVFGLSCLIGGFRFQVQELRITTGNASIGMLMLAVAGLALPAALMLSDEMVEPSEQKQYVDKNGDGISDINDGPSKPMIGFSRFDSVIMVVGYIMYLVFQLGSHQDEFEDQEEEGTTEVDVEQNGAVARSLTTPPTKRKAKRNKFCGRLFGAVGLSNNDPSLQYRRVTCTPNDSALEIEMPSQNGSHHDGYNDNPSDSLPLQMVTDFDEDTVHISNVSNRKRDLLTPPGRRDVNQRRPQDAPPSARSSKSHCSDGSEEEPPIIISNREEDEELEEHVTFRMGLVWLSIITMSISAMSDILVDTIDGFAYKYGISEVFTSLVILPYFSNIAEQGTCLLCCRAFHFVDILTAPISSYSLVLHL